MAKIKQVIVVRKDLNMRKGKIASQVAHASLGAVFSGSYMHDMTSNVRAKVIPLDPELEHWFNKEFTKICVSCDSEEELVALHKAAEDAGLRCCIITDAGHTEFNGVPTLTTLAIGPASSDDIDKITGGLKLL